MSLIYGGLTVVPVELGATFGGQAVPIAVDIAGGSAAALGSDLSLDQAVAAAVVAGVLYIDVSRSDTFSVLLTTDITSIFFDNWPTDGFSKRVAIYFEQDESGDHVVTWPANVKWSSGVPHSLSTTAGSIDCFVFGTFDAGATVFGNVVGLGYA